MPSGAIEVFGDVVAEARQGAIGRVKLVLAVGEELAVFGEEDEEEAVKEREGVGAAGREVCRWIERIGFVIEEPFDAVAGGLEYTILEAFGGGEAVGGGAGDGTGDEGIGGRERSEGVGGEEEEEAEEIGGVVIVEMVFGVVLQDVGEVAFEVGLEAGLVGARLRNKRQSWPLVRMA